MDPQLTVYFDGACPLCSREIDHYRRRDPGGRLRLVDIAAPAFDAAGEGLEPAALTRELHVRLPSGEVVTAVPAFVAIWRALGWERLAGVAESGAVMPLLSLGYRAFARLRPLLPRRARQGCEGGACPAR